MKLIFLFIMSTSLFGFGLESQTSNSPQKNNKVSYTQMISLMELSKDPEQTFGIGVLYMNGIKDKDDYGQVLQKDLNKALFYFDKSINDGYLKGYGMVGGLLLYNKNLKEIKGSDKLSKKYLTKAIAVGDRSAYVYLADLYTRNNDFQKAIDVLMTGANSHDSTSQYMIAKFYHEGLVDPMNKKQLVFKDEKKALYFLNLACSNNSKTEKLQKMCFNSKYVTTEELKTQNETEVSK